MAPPFRDGIPGGGCDSKSTKLKSDLPLHNFSGGYFRLANAGVIPLTA